MKDNKLLGEYLGLNLDELEYLDLRGNEIVKKIHLNEFGSKLRVLLKDSLIIK